jgi:hypothetical protein
VPDKDKDPNATAVDVIRDVFRVAVERLTPEAQPAFVYQLRKDRSSSDESASGDDQ